MSKDEDLSHFVPRRLDDSGKFLFWDMDVAIVALLGILVGISIDMQIIGLILGFVLAYMYSKLKSGKHPGVATHLMYWFTGAPSPKELPASHIRELNG